MAVNQVIYDGETLIDLTEDSVTPETLAEGVTAHDASGEQIVGTYSPPSLASQTPGTATAEDIASGTTAWVDGVMVTGSHACSSEYEFITVAANTTVAKEWTFVTSLDSISASMAAPRSKPSSTNSTINGWNDSVFYYYYNSTHTTGSYTLGSASDNVGILESRILAYSGGTIYLKTYSAMAIAQLTILAVS